MSPWLQTEIDTKTSVDTECVMPPVLPAGCQKPFSSARSHPASGSDVEVNWAGWGELQRAVWLFLLSLSAAAVPRVLKQPVFGCNVGSGVRGCEHAALSQFGSGSLCWASPSSPRACSEGELGSSLVLCVQQVGGRTQVA